MSDATKICRTCLITNQTLISVGSEIEDSLHSKDEEPLRIIDCFRIHLNMTVPLNKSICLKCLDKLLLVRKFHLQCLESEKCFKVVGSVLPNDEVFTESSQSIKVEHYYLDSDRSNIVGRDVNGIRETLPESNSIVGSSSIKRERNSLDSDSEGELTDVEGKFFPKTTNTRNKRPIYCLQCHEIFETKNILRKHFNSDHGKANNAGECLRCRLIFPTRGQLMEHLPTHKFSYECAVCTYCDRKFRVKANYVAHLRTHTGERPYVCQTCGKTFAQRTALTTHMILHSGKQISCSQCDRKFSVKSQLILHSRIHNGEKPFACSHCPKKFRMKSFLQNHLQSHEGSVKATCHLCGASFLHKSSLRIHMFTHKKKPFGCPKCPEIFTEKGRFDNHLYLHAMNDNANMYIRTDSGELTLIDTVLEKDVITLVL